MKKELKRILLLGIFLLLALIIGLVYTGKAQKKLEQAQYPLKYQEFVEKYAAACDVDKYLVYAFIRTESGFDPDAVSNVGARGLMQLTEEAYSWVALRLERTIYDNYDLMFDPETNILYGTYFIYLSLERYNGDISTAAAAYHSGWGTVDKLLQNEEYTDDGVTLKTFPYPQMRNYVYKINKNYDMYCKLYNNEGE